MKKLKNGPFALLGLTAKQARFVCEYLKTFQVHVAAETLGLSPEKAHQMMKDPLVQSGIEIGMTEIYENAKIDAEWVLNQLVDNHFLARQQGNLAASNVALNTIAKHATVDAFAAEKVTIASDAEKVERLQRARKRLAEGHKPDGPSDIEGMFNVH